MTFISLSGGGTLNTWWTMRSEKASSRCLRKQEKDSQVALFTDIFIVACKEYMEQRKNFVFEGK